MIYPYLCPNIACNHDFEVIKSVAEMGNTEHCPKCDTIAKRYISRTYFYGASDWDTAHYDAGLGQTVKNNKEAMKIARSRGLLEVGTENIEQTVQHNAKRREQIIEEKSAPAMEALEYGLKKELGKI